ncbi:MAG TPA: ActS/PrrB/RegB family redox-sensitive histidine kinase [Hyphomicrobiaceae bacterium]|jgi:two-component system sensor histidine kinase RegB|nr:ActS/PrrB/RegB family redox-sensitive histidine kinase [Hyphomicrobiaceae bacterium]
MLQLERSGKEGGESRLRLQTAVRLRWFGVVGQLTTICYVRFVLGFPFDIGICLALIALSAWLNVFLRMRYPARTRLSSAFATLLLAYDILQLAALLYLTGGIENPFVFLLVAPVTVSAATQPPRNTIALGVLGAAATTFLVFFHRPLPWYPPGGFDLPTLYDLGALASVLAGMLFLALYAWRLAKESRQMADALAATEMVLAREQQLHALDGLAAAAAHELGTPLSTIAVVAKELARGAPQDGTFADDLALLQTQAERCREILRRLTRGTQQPDPLLTHVTVRELIEEASAPYRGASAKIVISAAPEANGEPARGAEPVGRRRPGVIYGLGNIISNAVDFALSKVEIGAAWSAREVVITITDDGPGISPLVLDALGEPYVTTRPARHAERTRDGQPHGMGLGFFIAKTLLERSGATVSLENRPAPATGAIARVSWPRAAFEGPETAGYGPAERPAELAGAGRG